MTRSSHFPAVKSPFPANLAPGKHTQRQDAGDEFCVAAPSDSI